MELYVFGLLGVMVLTTLVLKGLFCWMELHRLPARQSRAFVEKRRKELSSSKSKLMHMEIPMEDVERTSTPVPAQEKKQQQRYDIQSDV